MESTTKVFGVRHRTKRTVEGESRPTEVCILSSNGDIKRFELEDEEQERRWLLGMAPDKAVEGEKVKKQTDYTNLTPAEGDVVALPLGGSGDYLAFALCRQSATRGFTVTRMPSRKVKEKREELGRKIDDDALTIAELGRDQGLYSMRPSDLQVIRVRECLRDMVDVMKARIGAEQRLRQRTIGRVFMNGLSPERSIQDQHDEIKTNDRVLNALIDEEKQAEKAMVKALAACEIYTRLLEPIEGMGPRIAARLIATVGDIRSFQSMPGFKTFLGVGLSSDGKFRRKKRGEVCNWNPDSRQALFLFGDQCNRRPSAKWGLKLREYKGKLHEKYPEKIVENGKTRYNDGHIHKMATWKTLTKFAEWLWREWRRLDAAGDLG